MPVDLDLLRTMRHHRPLREALEDGVLADSFRARCAQDRLSDDLDFWAAAGAVLPTLRLPAALRGRTGTPTLARARDPRATWLFERFLSQVEGAVAPQPVAVSPAVREALTSQYLSTEGEINASKLRPDSFREAAVEVERRLERVRERWVRELDRLAIRLEQSVGALSQGTRVNPLAVELMRARDAEAKSLRRFAGGTWQVWGPTLDGLSLLLLGEGDRPPTPDRTALARKALVGGGAPDSGQWARQGEGGQATWLVTGQGDVLALWKRALEAMGAGGLSLKRASRAEVEEALKPKPPAPPKPPEASPSMIRLTASASGYQDRDKALSEGVRRARNLGQSRVSAELEQFIKKLTAKTHPRTLLDLMARMDQRSGTGWWCFLYLRPQGGVASPEVWLFRGSSADGISEPMKPSPAGWIRVAKA